MKPVSKLILVALTASPGIGAQESPVVEVAISNYRFESVPHWFVCPDGTERSTFSRRWIIFEAEVRDVVSGQFEQESITFASESPLNFQCVELSSLPAGRVGEQLRDLGAGFQARAAECGDFKPRCEPEPLTGTRDCYWDGFYLELDDSPQALQQPNVELVEAFLQERNFRLVDSLHDLPADVLNLLPGWPDGTVAIAEKGDTWNQSDIVNSCNRQKNAQHFVSGISRDLAVVFVRRGGFAVVSKVRILDRRTADHLICFVDEESMVRWNGSNHTESLIGRSAEGEFNCRSVPSSR